ncbi:MAG: metallophosphoesterase [Pseudomonadota bacterium]|nr:metallophosphoesterase [Pseudomonadota bacterium]
MARTLIIGDIHGSWDELQDLFARVGLTDEDVVVSVGDLVDRGPAPGEVVAWFRGRANAVVVCGNHERKHVRGTMSHSQDITRLQLGAGYADAVAWMGTLPYWYETDAVRVVHAALIPGVPLAETPQDILCGTVSGEERLKKRLAAAHPEGTHPEGTPGPWWHELYDDPKPVVFGHHVVEAPIVREGRVYGIDTGCVHGWSLTALVLPSFELVSVPSRGDRWREVRQAWQVPVLRERDWRGMTFEQIEKKLGDLSRGAEADTIAFLDGVRAWIADLRAAIPRLSAALDAQIGPLLVEHGEEGFARAASAHPAGVPLIQRKKGRLSDAHLGCATPGAVYHLAEALGVGLVEGP